MLIDKIPNNLLIILLSYLLSSENNVTFKSKYHTNDELNAKSYNANQYFSIFHLNINSLQYHKTDLDALHDSLKVKHDVIAISETRLRKSIGTSSRQT